MCQVFRWVPRGQQNVILSFHTNTFVISDCTAQWCQYLHTVV